jgi:hypothetical protein
VAPRRAQRGRIARESEAGEHEEEEKGAFHGIQISGKPIRVPIYPWKQGHASPSQT